MASFHDWRQKKDEEIRAGRGASVRAEILVLLKDGRPGISRAEKCELAALCRRVGLYLPALSLLHPAVRPKARAPSVALPEEKLEYAGALVQAGAEGEGLLLLKALGGDAPPNALLFQAFAHFARWDYGASLPVLRLYRAHSALNNYEKLIAGVNLAAALVIERRGEEARALLAEVLRNAGNENALLRANLWEISAQEALQRRDFSRARDCLNRSSVLSPGSSLFLEKWKAVLAALEEVRRVDALEKVRSLALAARHWETLREMDLFTGLAQRDSGPVEKAYFGSPAGYRARIEREWGGGFSGNVYDWQHGRRGKVRLDLVKSGLKTGQILDRTLKLLASDFYRPFHWVNLHSRLFPERHLNPASSARVIHQAIKRSRAWLRMHSPDVEILEYRGEYRLKLGGPGRIRVPARFVPKEEAWLGFLPNGEFTAVEAEKAWGRDKHAAIRRLNRLIEEGKVARAGRGRATVYRQL